MQSFIKKGQSLIALAPMANYSDSPYRLLCRRLGSDFSFSEFISTDALDKQDPNAFNLLRFVEAERPIVFQIFGTDPVKLLNAARYIETLEPDGIDINMGCSVKFVAHKGSGAGMLRDPVETGRIFSFLASRLKTPLSAKIRLGWDDNNLNYLEVAHILEDSGASFLSVHGRTKMQGYTGRADWDRIGEIATRSSIPVLGNGDIESRVQALEKIEKYNLDGVLIGRKAIGNPFIFSSPLQIQEGGLHTKQWVFLILSHLDSMLNHYGERGLILFRKHATQYLRQMNVDPRVRRELLTINEVDNFRRITLDLLEERLQVT